jgi:hypothetical protein
MELALGVGEGEEGQDHHHNYCACVDGWGGPTCEDPNGNSDGGGGGGAGVIACHEFLEQHCPGGGLMPHKVYDDDDDALDVAAAERICTDCTTSCQIKTVSSNEPNPCLRMPQEVQQWCHHEAEAEAARSPPPPPPPVKPVPPTTTPVACNSLHSCEECEAYRTQQGIGYDTIPYHTT